MRLWGHEITCARVEPEALETWCSVWNSNQTYGQSPAPDTDVTAFRLLKLCAKSRNNSQFHNGLLLWIGPKKQMVGLICSQEWLSLNFCLPFEKMFFILAGNCPSECFCGCGVRVCQRSVRTWTRMTPSSPTCWGTVIHSECCSTLSTGKLICVLLKHTNISASTCVSFWDAGRAWKREETTVDSPRCTQGRVQLLKFDFSFTFSAVKKSDERAKTLHCSCSCQQMRGWRLAAVESPRRRLQVLVGFCFMFVFLKICAPVVVYMSEAPVVML